MKHHPLESKKKQIELIHSLIQDSDVENEHLPFWIELKHTIESEVIASQTNNCNRNKKEIST